MKRDSITDQKFNPKLRASHSVVDLSNSSIKTKVKFPPLNNSVASYEKLKIKSRKKGPKDRFEENWSVSEFK